MFFAVYSLRTALLASLLGLAFLSACDTICKEGDEDSFFCPRLLLSDDAELPESPPEPEPEAEPTFGDCGNSELNLLEQCDGGANCSDDCQIICSTNADCADVILLCREDGSAFCDQSTQRCVSDALVAEGEACAPGVPGSCDARGNCLSCEDGLRGRECDAGDICVQGTVSCDANNSNPVCATTGFTPSGQSCDNGAGICDGQGSCANCGATCTPENPCETGIVDCAGAEPACLATGIQPHATPCPSGFCDDSGICVSCENEGLACSIPGECFDDTSTAIVCVGDNAVCTGRVLDGNACGNGGTCGADGYCACPPAGSCDPDPLACYDTTDTSCPPAVNGPCRGVQLHPSGTVCGTDGTCDGAGSCVECARIGESCIIDDNTCALGSITCDAPPAAVCDIDPPTLAPAGRACADARDGFCDGNGVCISCDPTAAGTACDPGVDCTTGVTGCNAGTQAFCAPSGAAVDGALCENGICRIDDQGVGFCESPTADPRRVDDDGDGFCEDGTDLNGDGFCLDALNPDNPEEGVGPGDCNDQDARAFPGAPTLCQDAGAGKFGDFDCNGSVDFNDAACVAFSDNDGDGVCVNGMLNHNPDEDRDCADTGEGAFVGNGDCAPDDASISPLAVERCGGAGGTAPNGVDENCNGLVDETCRGCGNGFVEFDLGEQCDPAVTGGDPACTGACVFDPALCTTISAQPDGSFFCEYTSGQINPGGGAAFCAARGGTLLQERDINLPSSDSRCGKKSGCSIRVADCRNVATAPTVPSASSACEPASTGAASPADIYETAELCIWIRRDVTTQANAAANCARVGGQLLEWPEDAAKRDDISTNLFEVAGTTGAFVGVHFDGSVWLWDQTPVVADNELNWLPSQPRAQGRNCALVTSNPGMASEYCGNGREYVCERVKP